jgi:hypothetical protein
MFEFKIEFDYETLIFTADISLFINEDYEGNKYPEVEYENQELSLHIYSEVLNKFIEMPIEIDGDVFIKYITHNKELEQEALKQLTGE